MISKTTIEQVKDLNLAEALIKVGADIKKAGADYKGKCPFHNEKSASFSVSPSKGAYKCFGCGVGGNNVIQYLIEKNGLDFPTAAREAAEANGIVVEYDENAKNEEYVQQQQTREQFLKSTRFAQKIFESDLSKLDKKHLRGYPSEIIELLGIGYANETYDRLKDGAIGEGISTKDLLTLGLLTKKEGKSHVYDKFRDRVTFPIYNLRSDLVGFSGANVGELCYPNTNKKIPKYINSDSSDLFNKSTSLLGLNIAKEHIRKLGFAYIVEGNWDVVAMHHANKPNTVAPCGTALTPGQLQTIKKIGITSLVMIYDGDIAGFNAANKNIELALLEGFEVELVIMPKDKDPDDIKDELETYIHQNKTDAILWKANNLFKKIDSPSEQTKSEKALTELLAKIQDPKLRINYAKTIAKKHKLKENEVKNDISIHLNEQVQEIGEFETALPRWADREDYNRYGFAERNDKEHKAYGYYFADKEGRYIPASNFTVRPLFHVYSADKGDKNKRLIELNNGSYKAIMDLPSKNFVSVQQFRENIIAEGNYQFTGSAGQFNAVMGKILEKLPKCHELTTLGWQPEGFYAFSNGIFDQQFKPVDRYGIATFGEISFFSPAFSEVYKNVRTDDDLFENERFFTYKPSKIKFEQWAKQLTRVYGINGTVGTAYFLTSIFRDLIYDRYKFFPLLFLQGDRGLGKSQLSNSLCHIFTNKLPPFNLTAGTNVGFFRKLAQARNSIVGYAEYNHDIDPKRHQALKAAYDGVGHEKGTMSKSNRTESTKVNSAVCIDGQYLPTGDGNALFTRSILLSFTRVERTQEDKAAFAKLKEWEKDGLSGLVGEILIYREYIEENYTETLTAIESTIKNELNGKDVEDRILMNFSVILTTYKLLADKITMPMPYDKLMIECLELIIDLSSKINNSDALANFWQSVEFLLDQKMINHDLAKQYTNTDFDIKVVDHVRTLVHQDTEENKQFYTPKKVIFLRLNTIHRLYMNSIRQQTGETGIDLTSLKTYFKNSKTFIGYVKAWRFDGKISGAYAFDYEKLQSYGINLEGIMKKPAPVVDEIEESNVLDEQPELPY